MFSLKIIDFSLTLRTQDFILPILSIQFPYMFFHFHFGKYNHL